MFSDSGKGHTRQLRGPDVSASGNWVFDYSCLGFKVLSMRGQANGPARANGDLTGTVRFTHRQGLRPVRLRLPDPGAHDDQHRARRRGSRSPTRHAPVGQVVTFDASGSTDRQTPRDLDYTWSFDDGGAVKDATGARVRHAFTQAGTYAVLVRVDDPKGEAGFKRVTITVG